MDKSGADSRRLAAVEGVGCGGRLRAGDEAVRLVDWRASRKEGLELRLAALGLGTGILAASAGLMPMD